LREHSTLMAVSSQSQAFDWRQTWRLQKLFDVERGTLAGKAGREAGAASEVPPIVLFGLYGTGAPERAVAVDKNRPDPRAVVWVRCGS
jgi:hypothetical protein